MSGRHTVNNKRFIRAAVATAVVVPLGVIAAGSASAVSLPGGLGDTDSGLTSTVNSVANTVGVADLASTLGVVSNPTQAISNPTALVSGVTKNTPAAGVIKSVPGLPGGDVLGSVTNLTGGSSGLTKSLTTDSPLSGLGLGQLPLGLGDTVDGLLNTVTGTLSPVLGGVLGGTTKAPTSYHPTKLHFEKETTKPAYENTALPHTGGSANTEAMLACAGLGLAGAGVTLVARRRGGIGA